jgi:hypothetical protein
MIDYLAYFLVPELVELGLKYTFSTSKQHQEDVKNEK